MPQLNFNSLAPSPVASLIEGYTEGRQTRNKLMQQEQQQKMSDITLQNAMREQKMAEEESAAYKAVGGDMTKLPGELMQRGLGKQSMDASTKMQTIKTQQMAQAKTKLDIAKYYAGQVYNDPENALTILQQYSKRTGEDISDDLERIRLLGGTPEAAKKYAQGFMYEVDKLLPKFQTVDRNNQVDLVGYHPLTGEVISTNSFKKGMAPGEAVRIENDNKRRDLEERRVVAAERRVDLLERNAQNKQDAAAAKQNSGVGQLKAIVDTIDEELKSLEKLGGISSKNNSALSNIQAGLASSPAGQLTGRLVGTPEQTIRDNIASSRLQLLTAIASASGVKSAQLNSNEELKRWLDSLTDVNKSIETNEYILKNIENFIDYKRKENGLPPRSGNSGGGGAKKPPASTGQMSGGVIDYESLK